jgi:predicted transcriptional regulator
MDHPTVLKKYPWAPISKTFLLTCALPRRERAVLVAMLVASAGTVTTTVEHKELAAMSGYAREEVCRAIAMLRDLGWVKSVKETGKAGGIAVTYEITILVDTADELTLLPKASDGTEVVLDPVKVEHTVKSSKPDLWALLLVEVPLPLRTAEPTCKRLFNKMSFEKQAQAIAAMKVYAAAFASAPADKQTFFPRLKTWLTDGLYTDPPAVVWARAGKKAEGTVPLDQNGRPIVKADWSKKVLRA